MMDGRSEKSCFSRVLLHIHIVISILTALAVGDNCVKQTSCSCKTSTRTVDLSYLSSKTGTPRFTTPLVAQTQYFYNPCKEFTKPGAPGTQGITGDVIQLQGGKYYPLGQDSTALFNGDPDAGKLTLTYKQADTSTPPKTRTSIFNIICGNDVLSFKGETQSSLTYNFELGIQQLCPPGQSGGISTGSILVILFFVFLAVYLIAGILFLKFVRRAEGIESVPNFEFWKALPGLIRDGCYFTFRGCKAESTYEKI